MTPASEKAPSAATLPLGLEPNPLVSRVRRITCTAVPRVTLEIEVSATAGVVSGTVQNDQQQPSPGVAVVLIPQEPERREEPQYYRTASTDDAGRFTLKNLIPGQYKVYAWPGIEAGAYMDPDFLRPVESRGEPVTVRDGGQETVQVKLIG